MIMASSETLLLLLVAVGNSKMITHVHYTRSGHYNNLHFFLKHRKAIALYYLHRNADFGGIENAENSSGPNFASEAVVAWEAVDMPEETFA
ncbi:hypothetical protein KIN20_017998 [Parelaphostrongylus tenuis]|uniref:Uncharacterized protein n=1 Tax=Parelaphostrongylus tenuis TaxID=148309 RepID=A0AAD5QRW0_PARTN|nr:hypothetical protein KIN20_017998 [Parelaphostrongylus tenuis]